ncbi:hypothetical protein DFH06DRAFT_1208761 [Mycena polygramma]|nr:hypothetical protein DFH06DRAFT_1208761 [Mycena polygramma]
MWSDGAETQGSAPARGSAVLGRRGNCMWCQHGDTSGIAGGAAECRRARMQAVRWPVWRTWARRSASLAGNARYLSYPLVGGLYLQRQRSPIPLCIPTSRLHPLPLIPAACGRVTRVARPAVESRARSTRRGNTTWNNRHCEVMVTVRRRRGAVDRSSSSSAVCAFSGKLSLQIALRIGLSSSNATIASRNYLYL